MNFKPLAGDDLGVFHNENYQIVQCFGGHIVFSYSRKGGGITAHIASDKHGLRHIKPAINAFCSWLFRVYTWCKVIFAIINKERLGIMRLVKKCGFNLLAENDSQWAYTRSNHE